MYPYKNPLFSLRIRQDVLDKMRYIAFQSSRSANKEIEQACIAYISEYEDLHGVISPDDLSRLD